MPAQFKEKFIAFVDILGFKNLVNSSASGGRRTLDELLEILSDLGNERQVGQYIHSGGTYCPMAPRKAKSLDFCITQISDCVVVSTEISPAGIVNLIAHCSTAVTKLLFRGVMCRGYITRGHVYHTDRQIVGPGYQAAYESEAGVTAFSREADERGTPFVEIDSVVAQYIDEQPDSCVKEMVGRMTKRSGNTLAIFPFGVFSHSFSFDPFGEPFDSEKEAAQNQKMREFVIELQGRVRSYVDPDNDRAAKKAEHYIDALDKQLRVAEQMDEVINLMDQPLFK